MDDRIGYEWDECRPFEGVPMRTSMLSPLTDGMEAGEIQSDPVICHDEEAIPGCQVRDSLAVLYASLSQVSLRLRLASTLKQRRFWKTNVEHLSDVIGSILL